jgi:hypothetical protein
MQGLWKDKTKHYLKSKLKYHIRDNKILYGKYLENLPSMGLCDKVLNSIKQDSFIFIKGKIIKLSSNLIYRHSKKCIHDLEYEDIFINSTFKKLESKDVYSDKELRELKYKDK